MGCPCKKMTLAERQAERERRAQARLDRQRIRQEQVAARQQRQAG